MIKFPSKKDIPFQQDGQCLTPLIQHTSTSLHWKKKWLWAHFSKVLLLFPHYILAASILLSSLHVLSKEKVSSAVRSVTLPESAFLCECVRRHVKTTVSKLSDVDDRGKDKPRANPRLRRKTQIRPKQASRRTKNLEVPWSHGEKLGEDENSLVISGEGFQDAVVCCCDF